MRFFDHSFFQLLFLLPVMVILFLILRRVYQRRLNKVFGQRLTPFLTSSLSIKKVKIKFVLELFILLLLVLTLARPQAGQTTQKEQSEGLEIVIIADVSPSMLSEDDKPSRLEHMKITLKRLVHLLGGSKIGIVGLSGSSMLLSPLTNDQSALDMYIDSLSTNSVSTLGTDFKQAFRIAIEALERGGTTDEDDVTRHSGASRVAILASDGENHEDGAKEAVGELKAKGIRLFTITFGTQRGSPIPIRDERGYLAGYKKDRDGQVVLSQSHHELMQELARLGDGGSYYADFSGDVIKNLTDDLDSLEKGEFESRVTTTYEERFQIPLILAIILALIEMSFGNRRKPGRIWRGRFEPAA